MSNKITIVKPLALRLSLAALALLLVLASQPSLAIADDLGGIAGIITDAGTGAPISGVQVKFNSPSQTATATTDAKGHFVVLSLPPDNYTLTMVKSGYDTREASGYSVYADQTQQYDFQLTKSTAASSGSP
ncbi:MAG TPA: carboxypeptidase-like regulatory domain-containing protein [Candidatus Cybelea sp.]|nr:carboxypeptidase-like regulatory domain-containing protein [Candidatus Cybelea sp.]